jgi:hypothetical protein
MTEIVLFGGVAIAATVHAALLSRRAPSPSALPTDVRPYAEALHSAVVEVLVALGRWRVAAAFATALLLGALRFVSESASVPAGTRAATCAWVAGGSLLGSLFSWVVTVWAARGAASAAGGCFTRARRSMDDALACAMSAGASGVVLVTAPIVVVVVALTLLATSEIHGVGGEMFARARELREALFGMCAGVALGAVFVHAAASTYVASVARLAEDAESPELDDPRNPAALAHAVGGILDAMAPTATALAAVVTVCVALSELGSALHRANPGKLGTGLMALSFPWVLSALALFATCFGAGVVRAEPDEPPLRAGGRGLLVFVVLASASIVGAALWLYGGHAPALGGATATGWAVTLASLGPRSDGPRGAPYVSDGDVFPAGAAVSTLSVAAALALSSVLGEATSLRETTAFVTGLSAVGMAIGIPLAAVTELACGVIRAAARVSRLSASSGDETSGARLARLLEAADLVTPRARTVAVIGAWGAGFACIAAVAARALAARTDPAVLPFAPIAAGVALVAASLWCLDVAARRGADAQGAERRRRLSTASDLSTPVSYGADVIAAVPAAGRWALALTSTAVIIPALLALLPGGPGAASARVAWMSLAGASMAALCALLLGPRSRRAGPLVPLAVACGAFALVGAGTAV